MSTEHVIKIGQEVVKIVSVSESVLVIESVSGRKATYYTKSKKVVFRHSVTGKFCTKQY